MFILNYEIALTSFSRRNDRELKFARTLIFTVEEINSSPQLLPGVTLGYRIYKGCGANHLIRASLEAVNGAEQGCGRGRVQALLGHSSSGPSGDINRAIGPLHVPQVR